MYKNILLIVLLLVSITSCTNLSPATKSLAASTATLENPNSSISTSTPLIQVMSPPTSAQEATSTDTSFHYSDLKPGQYIIYQGGKAGEVNLSALSPYTGKIYSLYNIGYLADIVLSPSRHRLAIVKDQQVELIDLEASSTRTINFKNVCNSAAWSPDESRLALVCGEVFIVSFSDLNIFQLTDLFTTHRSEFGEVSWSPNGTWLAYNNIADPYGNDPYDGIYVTDTTCLSIPTDCKNQTKFHSGLFYQFVSIAWSPDSSKLAFLALASIFILDIDSMKIDSSIELPYRNVSDFTGLAWSSDGSQFVISNELTKTISVLSSNDGKETSSFPIVGTVLSWIKVDWHFANGDVYQITSLGDNLNLREKPTTNSKILTKLRSGDKITILSGPIVAGGYAYWKVKMEQGVEGWVVDIPDWYQSIK